MTSLLILDAYQSSQGIMCTMQSLTDGDTVDIDIPLSVVYPHDIYPGERYDVEFMYSFINVSKQIVYVYKFTNSEKEFEFHFDNRFYFLEQ